MIAANGVDARSFLSSKGYASLRRVLRVPKRWDRIVELAASLGERLPATPSAPALDDFLDKRRRADPERFPDLSLSVVKLLGSGEYAVEIPGEDSEGHFGLAVRDYTHSTAPNRRFPDLVAQRLLKTALDGRAPAVHRTTNLRRLPGHCTMQEDNAAKVERQVRKSAAALLLLSRIGERFDAIVTGASEKGTWVRISKPTAEGKVVKGFEGSTSATMPASNSFMSTSSAASSISQGVDAFPCARRSWSRRWRGSRIAGRARTNQRMMDCLACGPLAMRGPPVFPFRKEV